MGFFDVIADEDIVENGARFHLPQIETNSADFFEFADRCVGGIFGVVDFRVDPDSLVAGVVNLLGFPFALVFRVVDHGGFPFTVHLIVPIFGLFPVFRLDIFRVINLGSLVPVFGFLGFRILDGLGGEEVPVSFQISRLNFFIVDQDFIGLVRFDNQSVQVGVDIILWSNFFLDQMVLSLVVEDNMDFLA